MSKHTSRAREWFVGLSKQVEVYTRNNRDLMQVVLVPLLTVLLYFAATYSFSIDIPNPHTLLFLLLFVIVWYVFMSENERSTLSRHQTIVGVLSVIVSILFVSTQFYVENTEEYNRSENFIKEENNRNYIHLTSVINDLTNDPNTVFWRDFSVEHYIAHWDRILRKSQECMDLYASLTIQLSALNNINKMRQQLILVPNNLHSNMLSAASSTKPVFDQVISRCQDN